MLDWRTMAKRSAQEPTARDSSRRRAVTRSRKPAREGDEPERLPLRLSTEIDRREFPVNAAMRKIIEKHQLRVHEVARILHVSIPTVYSWFRSKPTRAPKMALALLCHELGLPQHNLISPWRKNA